MQNLETEIWGSYLIQTSVLMVRLTMVNSYRINNRITSLLQNVNLPSSSMIKFRNDLKITLIKLNRKTGATFQNF